MACASTLISPTLTPGHHVPTPPWDAQKVLIGSECWLRGHLSQLTFFPKFHWACWPSSHARPNIRSEINSVSKQCSSNGSPSISTVGFVSPITLISVPFAACNSYREHLTSPFCTIDLGTKDLYRSRERHFTIYFHRQVGVAATMYTVWEDSYKWFLTGCWTGLYQSRTMTIYHKVTGLAATETGSERFFHHRARWLTFFDDFTSTSGSFSSSGRGRGWRCLFFWLRFPELPSDHSFLSIRHLSTLGFQLVSDELPHIPQLSLARIDWRSGWSNSRRTAS